MKLILKIKTFFKSLFWHIWAGFPKSTKEQIEYRFNICKNCELFDAKNSQCLVCGCNLSTKKIFMNKLAWADQECPKGKWSKIS
jgi:uncharacterized paraquat-inducible protein A